MNMELKIDEKFYKFSLTLDKPLYIVGGYVRNFLIDGTVSDDIDVASELSEEEFIMRAVEFGFFVVAEYKRTGTAVISDGVIKYEYSSFRKESYTFGEHTPTVTKFNATIEEDALRRDFKCNAVYYDVKNKKYVDVLGGISDINNKILDTVKPAEEVFCSDGLRLMRLARLSAELNFKPTESVIKEALRFSDNILYISPERISAELKRILVSDLKYPFSDKKGCYNGLKILEKTGVLKLIFPEIKSVEPLRFADIPARFSLLFFGVDKTGIKTRLNAGKVDRNTQNETLFLCVVLPEFLDKNPTEKEIKIFIAEHIEKIGITLSFLGAVSKVYFEYKEKYERVKSAYESLIDGGAPLSVKDLKIDGKSLEKLGLKGKEIGIVLKVLFDKCVTDPSFNEYGKLLNFVRDTGKIS